MSALRSAASRVVARLLEWARPDLARRIASGDSTAASGRAGRMILRAQARRAARNGDWPALASRLASYWKSAEGDRFYDTYAERGARWFGDAHAPWADAVSRIAAGGAYGHLVEIGCGDGQVLAHFATRLPQLPHLTGIDLNPSIIARNRARFADDPRFSFIAIDALDWVGAHAEPGMFFTAYGGVFEYFPPDRLAALLTHIAAHPPSAVALVEPLDEDFDETRGISRPGGVEYSFSHPYRGMLERAGFTIRFSEEARIEHRWIMLVATREQDQP